MPADEDTRDERAAAPPASGDRRLFLIDGPSLVYRAFFALPESIATSTGVPTNAIFGFASMLVKIVTEYGVQPDRRRLGRRHLRAHRVSLRVQGAAALAPGPAQAAVAGDGTAGRGVRLLAT